MSAKQAVVITGTLGGLGRALVAAFDASGWFVLATDKTRGEVSGAGAFIACDLAELAAHPERASDFAQACRAAVGAHPIAALVNNAAVQYLGSVQNLSWSDWQETLAVNLSAPLAFTRAFLPDLKAARGIIINIGSVHATSTKPEFVAYATSKAAIHGLTRALAVDLGPEVRALTLAPAAVDTEMLRGGFEGRPEALAQLKSVHPVGRIASPQEIAQFAVVLATSAAGFASGAEFRLDGGILSRLHDPI